MIRECISNEHTCDRGSEQEEVNRAIRVSHTQLLDNAVSGERILIVGRDDRRRMRRIR